MIRPPPWPRPRLRPRPRPLLPPPARATRTMATTSRRASSTWTCPTRVSLSRVWMRAAGLPRRCRRWCRLRRWSCAAASSSPRSPRRRRVQGRLRLRLRHHPLGSSSVWYSALFQRVSFERRSRPRAPGDSRLECAASSRSARSLRPSPQRPSPRSARFPRNFQRQSCAPPSRPRAHQLSPQSDREQQRARAAKQADSAAAATRPRRSVVRGLPAADPRRGFARALPRGRRLRWRAERKFAAGGT